MATASLITRTGPDEYAPNAMTAVLTSPQASGMIINCHDGLTLMNSKLNEFFKKTAYANPTNKDASAFQHAAGTKLHYFKWIFQPGNEEQADAFHKHMQFKTLTAKWYERVDVKQLLGGDVGKEDVLLVDVGGDTGQDILGFHKHFPNLPGRLVLEDLPPTIKALD
jgi:hypothetical protein